MGLTINQFVDLLIKMSSKASEAGLRTEHQALALLIAALAIGDRETRGGLSRDQFQKLAMAVYDKVRGSLVVGIAS